MYRFEPVYDACARRWRVLVYEFDGGAVLHSTDCAECVGWCIVEARRWCDAQYSKPKV